MRKAAFLLAVIFFCCSNFGFAQTTFDRVYTILQTNCAGYCHNSGNVTGNLLMDGSKQDVMDNLVNVTPYNAVAAANGYKRIYPGDARKSFLFRKVNHGLDVNVQLENGEGDPMPLYGSPLSEVDREMIRQWIIFGAEDTVYPYADSSVIAQYYNGFAEVRTPALPIPDPSEGYQIYFGPIFLMPQDEVEFDSKFPLFNDIDVEVHKMHVEMNKESHHMAVFKYHPDADTATPAGLKQVLTIGDAAGLFFISDVVAQWPNSLELDLPQGTGLMWQENSVLNISYHILNYSDSIIAAEAYFNIYTRPQQSTTAPMLSYPVRYDGHPVYQGGWDVQNLILYPTATDTTLTMTQYSPDSTFYWNLWSIQAHTHQLGEDFDVYIRNPDGTKGEHIYEGYYDPEYKVNRGYYDWEHPPLRYFNPLKSVDMTVGLIHEATFNNDTPDTVGFGLKTTDEMFVTYIFFTKSQTPVGILDDKVFNEAHVKIYPNPAKDAALIHIGPDVELKNAELRIYDLIGRDALTIGDLPGNKFNVDLQQLSTGTYFYRLINDGRVAASGKIIVQE